MVYFVLLPFTFLTNCRETKEAILDTNWKEALTGIMKSSKKNEKKRFADQNIKMNESSFQSNKSEFTSIFTISTGETSGNTHNTDDLKNNHKYAKKMKLRLPPEEHQIKECWT